MRTTVCQWYDLPCHSRFRMGTAMKTRQSWIAYPPPRLWTSSHGEQHLAIREAIPLFSYSNCSKCISFAKSKRCQDVWNATSFSSNVRQNLTRRPNVSMWYISNHWWLARKIRTLITWRKNDINRQKFRFSDNSIWSTFTFTLKYCQNKLEISLVVYIIPAWPNGYSGWLTAGTTWQ